MKYSYCPSNYPNKCFVCGEGHKHRRKNKYRELCKSCATSFMLKGRFQKFRLPCFGSLNCVGSLNREEDYECPLSTHCGEARFADTQIPLEVIRVITNQAVNSKSAERWRKKRK